MKTRLSFRGLIILLFVGSPDPLAGHGWIGGFPIAAGLLD